MGVIQEGLKRIHPFFDIPPTKRQSPIALSLNLGWAELLPSEECLRGQNRCLMTWEEKMSPKVGKQDMHGRGRGHRAGWG